MAEEEQATALPSANVLNSLISKGKTTRDKTSKLNGEYGQAIADAEDKHKLHAKAFKAIAKLERMEPVALMSYLTHFDDYRRKLELDEKAGMVIPGLEEGTGDGTTVN